MFDKIRNTFIATAILYLVCGIIMLFFPATIINVGCYLVGIMFLFIGVSGVVMYIKTELKTSFTNVTLIMSIIFGAFGVYIFINPASFAKFIPLVIGVFLLVDAISKLSVAFDLKNYDYSNWWSMLIVAFIILACGILLVFNPFEALEMSVRVMGIILIVDSLSNIFTIYNYSKIEIK